MCVSDIYNVNFLAKGKVTVSLSGRRKKKLTFCFKGVFLFLFFLFCFVLSLCFHRTLCFYFLALSIFTIYLFLSHFPLEIAP